VRWYLDPESAEQMDLAALYDRMTQRLVRDEDELESVLHDAEPRRLATVPVLDQGIGTTAQALRAGRPMLIVPFSHDQPDNAARMVRLGVARTIARRRYSAARAAAGLEALIADPGYAAHARQAAALLQREHGAEAAADEIERVLAAP
jgi:predicted glycosyltransferase